MSFRKAPLEVNLSGWSEENNIPFLKACYDKTVVLYLGVLNLRKAVIIFLNLVELQICSREEITVGFHSCSKRLFLLSPE